MNIMNIKNDIMEKQAGFAIFEELKVEWVEKFMLLKNRTIPVISGILKFSDRLDLFGSRVRKKRSVYAVLPGLYALGSPDSGSSVFVTSNYKPSFDHLRSSIKDMNAWVLILDTKGVNVWCAAGKGTFGTKELVSRIRKVRLSEIVTHKKIILPQLGAVGVSAFEVKKISGFNVIWGPVRANDISAWITAGYKKSDKMRKITFNIRERMIVAIRDFLFSWKFALVLILIAGLYGLPNTNSWFERFFPIAILLLGTIPVGTLLFPALLPFLPFKSFALKGSILGIIWGICCALLFEFSPLLAIAAAIIEGAFVAYIGMIFTGSSTFTCQQGALQEVKKGIPVIIGSLATGLILSILDRIIFW